jgi:hypothetical protein
MAVQSPHPALDQVVEQVAVMAMDASDQERWAQTHSFPIDELMLQFSDMVPGWIPQLVASGAIDEADELRLLRMKVYPETMREMGESILWTESDQLAKSTEWQHLRVLADDALRSLCRPISDKNLAV